ncbi:MAG: IS200/IS605 family transposase [Verrucomicrobiota bacterium]
MDSRYIHKKRNVSVLMYHLVCSAKYRRAVMSKRVDELLRDVCLEIEKRWEIYFLEIGVDGDHAHFLIQSVPMYSPSKVVQKVKSVTAREVFSRAPEVKEKLWGGEFWGKGYFMNTVGQHGSEKVIAAYVKGQGERSDYQMLHKGQMNLGLF